MIFEIKNIIESDELKIKLLAYQHCPVSDLDMTALSTDERTRFSNFISDKRKLEYYFTRILWQSFDIMEIIKYSPTGKPYVSQGHISITHSRNTIVIAHAPNHEIGLDIEYYSPKVLRIRDKFLSDYEQNRFDTDNLKTMTTLWSIKEAVYKLLDIEGLNFKENIRITEVGEVNRVFVTIQDEEHAYVFFRLSFESFILIYCAGETLLHA